VVEEVEMDWLLAGLYIFLFYLGVRYTRKFLRNEARERSEGTKRHGASEDQPPPGRSP